VTTHHDIKYIRIKLGVLIGGAQTRAASVASAVSALEATLILTLDRKAIS
jgi:hypothetical protein